MQDITLLLTFAAATLALVATPGPDMLLIASRSASQGRMAGFACLAGVQVGTYVHAIAAAVGLSQLIAAAPMAYDAIRYAGAAYLLHLAWITVRAAPQAAAVSDRLSRDAPWTIFKQGLTTNILNPKMALFVLALFPQFIQPEYGAIVVQMLILATVINIIGLAVNGAVIVFVARIRGVIEASMRGSRLPQYLLGVVFAGLALRLAVESRR